MTRIIKPVVRESAAFDRGRSLIVALHPTHLELRPKGTRHSYTVSYEGILWLEVRRQVEEERRERKARKKGRRR